MYVRPSYIKHSRALCEKYIFNNQEMLPFNKFVAFENTIYVLLHTYYNAGQFRSIQATIDISETDCQGFNLICDSQTVEDTKGRTRRYAISVTPEVYTGPQKQYHTPKLSDHLIDTSRFYLWSFTQ